MTDNALNDRQNNDWESCEPGTVAGTVQGLRAQRRSQQLTTAAIGISAFAIFFALGFVGVKALIGEPSYGGIACSDVKSHLNEYLAENLDQEIAGQIDVHLSQCKHCRLVAERRREELQANTRPVSIRLSRTVAVRNQPFRVWRQPAVSAKAQ